MVLYAYTYRVIVRWFRNKGLIRLANRERSRTRGTKRLIDRLRQYESPEPELIVVVGGDGTMLRAIRQHWRDRLPFYGLNTGHLGFLLNDADGQRFWEDDLRLYQLPLLWVETVAPDGERLGGLAFNDCWVERESGQTGVLFVDLDNFKQINDEHGHRVGDELLAALGGRLQGAVRPADTVARIGGDEFVLVLPGIADSAIAPLVHRIEQAMSRPFRLRSATVSISASTGIATAPPHLTADELLADADHAMYAEKSATHRPAS